MRLKSSIFIAVLALAAASCLKNEIVYNTENVEYRTVEFSGPLAKIHIPLGKTLEKHLDIDELYINGDGVVCLRYVQSENIEWGDDIYLPGYPVKNWSIPVVTGGNAAFKIRLESSDEADSYLSMAVLNSGEISFTFSETGGHSGMIIITIPELIKDGAEFTKSIPLPALATPYKYPLEGYMIRTDDNHDMNVQFEVHSSGSGNLDVAFELSEMEASFITGYFGRLYKREEFTLDIDFFDELDFEGTISIKGIQMDAVTTNRAGLPMNVKADIFLVNEDGLNEQLMLHPPFDFGVDRATTTAIPKIEYFSTSLPEQEFGGAAGFPTKLKFVVEGTGNPNGNPSGDVVNFIVKNNNDHLANIDFTLTVPLHIKVDEYKRKDIIDFDYNDIVGNNDDQINNVEFLHINLVVENGLPFDITLEAAAINEEETYMFTILPESHIILDEKAKLEIKLDKNQLEDFRKEEVKQIVLYSSGKTKDSEYVIVKDSDFLDITVSVIKAKATIPSNF